MIRKISLLVLVSCWLCFGYSAAQAPFFQHVLPDLQGKKVDFAGFQAHTLTVVVFLEPDCPISQKYMVELNRLDSAYRQRGVRFYGIIPSPRIEVKAAKRFRREYRAAFPILLDRQQRTVDQLKAKITPEIFVVDREGEVRYRGAVDNWFYELGRYRSVVTEFYLKDAIEALLAGKPVTTTETEAFGCFIEAKN